jgi:hypothetical protein
MVFRVSVLWTVMMTKCSSVGGNLAPLPLSIVVKSLNSESLEYSLLRVSVMRTVAMERSKFLARDRYFYISY